MLSSVGKILTYGINFPLMLILYVLCDYAEGYMSLNIWENVLLWKQPGGKIYVFTRAHFMLFICLVELPKEKAWWEEKQIWAKKQTKKQTKNQTSNA